MKLQSIVDAESVICDGAKSVLVYATFIHETGPVKKSLQFTQYTKREDEHKRAFAAAFLKAAREAERDIAFRMFGDKWREHLPAGSFWTGPLTARENEMLLQARAMRPDLMPEPV